MSWPIFCVLNLHDLELVGAIGVKDRLNPAPEHFCQCVFLPRFVYHGTCFLLPCATACTHARISKMLLNQNSSSFST